MCRVLYFGAHGGQTQNRLEMKANGLSLIFSEDVLTIKFHLCHLALEQSFVG